MINSKAAMIDLQLDVSCVEESATNMITFFSRIEQVANNTADAISEVFSQIHSGLEPIGYGINSVFEDVSSTVYAFDSKIIEIEKLSGTAQKYLEIIKKAPSTEGGILSALLPKSAEVVKTVGGWFSSAMNPAMTKAIGNCHSLVSGMTAVLNPIKAVFKGIGSAMSGMNLGWGVIIAAIVALVVLIIDNWEAIKTALGAAAEWFNTNIIQPIVGFFTGLWTSITNIVSNIWNGIVSVCTGIAQWIHDNVIQPVLDFFTPILEWFSGLFSSIGQTISDIFHNIVVLVKGYLELVFTIWKTVGLWFYENVITPVVDFFVGLWERISSFAAEAWATIQNVFLTVAVWFNENVIQPVANFFAGLWEGIVGAASTVWEAIKGVFSTVANFFKDIFSKAWNSVVNVFSAAGEIFTNIKNAVLDVFKKIVNGLIDGINTVVAIPFNGINGALKLVKDIEILGITPFEDLRMINVPQIPHLAQGAVLPANKPFLAMVGDQRHGTNVEAPLATIQEAVAQVMENQFSGMMAGFEAIVSEVRSLRSSVDHIEVGDTTIGQAANRYNRRMAIIKGGV